MNVAILRHSYAARRVRRRIVSLAVASPTEWARVEQISIIRLVAGKQENIPFNLKRAIAGKYPEINIYVRPNDVIFVP